MLFAAALLTGCLEGIPSPGGGGLGVQASDNSAPQISGNPQYVAVEGDQYVFTPSSSDADGDPLTFTIRNKPAWAEFDAATGQLQGIPQFGDARNYDNIVITASDGRATASLPAMAITRNPAAKTKLVDMTATPLALAT